MKKNTYLQTPSQTVGPFFAYGLTAKQYDYPFPSLFSGNLIKNEVHGKVIIISGKVYDGQGIALDDAMVEIWQADLQGKYRTNLNDDFLGFGRMGTGSNEDRSFEFKTFKPGKVEKNLAPHVNITVFARGMLNHLFTRMYFSDEEEDNQKDIILNQIDPLSRSNLIANKVDDQNYRFDIFLQGEHETVFFDI
tara:strand:- start:1500 stop:2075 length:576 start_codon:yes stop_codon:yes gene_type:complete